MSGIGGIGGPGGIGGGPGGFAGAGGIAEIMALRQQIIQRSQLLQQVHTAPDVTSTTAAPTGGGFAYYADVWLSKPTDPNNWTLVQSPKPWLLLIL